MGEGGGVELGGEAGRVAVEGGNILGGILVDVDLVKTRHRLVHGFTPGEAGFGAQGVGAAGGLGVAGEELGPVLRSEAARGQVVGEVDGRGAGEGMRHGHAGGSRMYRAALAAVHRRGNVEVLHMSDGEIATKRSGPAYSGDVGQGPRRMCGLHMLGRVLGDEGGQLSLAPSPESLAVEVGQVLIPLPDGLPLTLEDLEERISGLEGGSGGH